MDGKDIGVIKADNEIYRFQQKSKSKAFKTCILPCLTYDWKI